MKKIKFTTPQNAARPIEIDGVELVRAVINFRDGGAELIVALMNGESVVEERPICCGTSNVAADVNLDKLESDILKVIQKSGVVPMGGTVEEK